MKICIAQTKSLKGKVQENIQNHLNIIERAIKLKCDLIIFPELSITSYEPDLAKELATNVENSIFNAFQELSDKNNITIGIGMPTITKKGINISMLIFQPNKMRVVYSKQMLHADELPYFICGNTQTYINIKGKKIAIGICYETLQREHIVNANQNGADIYIASVAKSKNGIDKANAHFSEISKEFNTPILMSNCVGFCDNFLSVGQSAVWNKNGNLIAQLDDKNQGILIYDTKLGTTAVYQTKIEKGQLSDLEALFEIYLNAKNELKQNGIYQWTDSYPSISIIESDLKKRILYLLKNDNEIIGAVNISEEQEPEYQSIDWKFDDSKVLVIHRLVINPKHQNKGNAKLLMDFAEDFAKENNYSSIRLDAYSQNNSVIEFYKKRNYFIRGEVLFPERVFAFYCMENEISNDENKISIEQYKKHNQSEINAMINEISQEFELPISNKNKSSSQPLDNYWVAFNKTEIIGTIGVLNMENNYAVLKNMFVKKEYRGATFGISQMLLEKVYDWCLTENISSIYLGTMSQFKAAHKFYEKNGFNKIMNNELPSSFIANPIDDVFYKKIVHQNNKN